MRVRRFSLLFAGLFAAFFAAAPAHAEKSYQVSFVGAPDGLEEKLRLISALEKNLRDYPTRAALRQAARRDRDAFNEALQSAGYYNGKANFTLTDDGPDQIPGVIFNIEPGPAFKIIEYEILYEDEFDGRPASMEAAGIKTDGSAAGANLRDLQVRFLDQLWGGGYPQAKIAGRRAIAEPAKGVAHAIFVFQSGPKASFGDVQFKGMDKVDSKFIRKLKTWKDGEEFDRALMIAYRDRLAETGLFTTINVSPGALDENGRAPIIVELEQRKRRTIGAGASYSTSEGPGGRLFFENRNIFGAGEKLRIEMRGTQIEQSINFGMDKPLPGLPGHAFANFEFANETTEAFDARSYLLSGGLAKKWLNDKLETRAALALETSKVETEGIEDRNYYISAPMSVLWDSENDLLNPTRGFRAGLVVTPYQGSQNFTQMSLSARSRINFGEDNRFTLAGRAGMGATFGVSLDELPLNKRLFAGGGGSGSRIWLSGSRSARRGQQPLADGLSLTAPSNCVHASRRTFNSRGLLMREPYHQMRLRILARNSLSVMVQACAI